MGEAKCVTLSYLISFYIICLLHYIHVRETQLLQLAVIADRTAYNVLTVVLSNRSQHEYLLIYSFERKSAFDGRQLFAVVWLNDTSYSKTV